MEAYANLTRDSWYKTIDNLEQQLEAAREMPPWAVAVIVLCGLSLLGMLVTCGFGCGVIVQQQQVSHEGPRNSLLASDSAAHELELQENVEEVEEENAQIQHGKKSKQKAPRETNDMEI